jgi:hypothetical protein
MKRFWFENGGLILERMMWKRHRTVNAMTADEWRLMAPLIPPAKPG